MLKRKITVCFSLFLLLIMLGWGVDQQIRLHEPAMPVPAPNEGFSIRSVEYNEPVNINMPFFPREYVRIIRRVSE